MSGEFPQGFEAVIDLLDDYAHHLAPEIDALKSSFRLATYHAYDPKGLKPKTIKMEDGEWPLRFYLRTLDGDIPVLQGKQPKQLRTWKLDRSFKPAEDKAKTLHLTTWVQLTDAVWDDKNEMAAAGFDYTGDLAPLSRSAREVFAKNLGDIEPPRYIVDGGAFLRSLAHHCTYDAQGDYYPKWIAGKENKLPYQGNLSPEYLANVGGEEEVTLQKGKLYALQFSATDAHFFELRGKKGALHRTLLFSVLAGAPPPYTAKKEIEKKRHVVYLVHAADGLQDEWKGNVRKVYGKDPGHTFTRIVDPQAMVEAASGKKVSVDLGLKDDFDWFVEMVKQYFPLRLHVYDTSWMEPKGVLQLDGVQKQLREEIQRVLKEEAGKHRGTTNAALDEQVRKFLDGNRKLVIIPQGYPTGEHSRFVGFDNYYAYERHLDTGTVAIMPIEDYLFALAVGDLARQVYKDTAWLIPFIKYTMIALGAFATLGTGAFLSGASVAALRSWVVQYAREKITAEVLEKIIVEKLYPALIALTVELELKIFSNNPEDTAGRVAAFAHGFFLGYLRDTLYDHFVKHLLIDNVKHAMMPREVRMALAVKNLYHVIDRFQRVVHTLENELDSAALHNGVKKFEGVATHLVRGVALLVSAIYYLPHDQAKPLLDVFGLDADKKPPDPDRWAAEAQKQLTNISRTLQDLLKLRNIDELLEDLKTSKVLKAAGALAVLEPEIIWGIEYTWEKHSPLKGKGWATFLGLLFLTLGMLDAQTEGHKVFKPMFALVSDMLKNLWNGTAEQEEKYGRLVGKIFGSVVLNNTMFGKDTPLGKLMHDRPVVGSVVWGNLKAGPIDVFLELLFNRYIELYERVTKVVHKIDSKDKVKDLLTRGINGLADEKLDRLDSSGISWGHLSEFHDDTQVASLQRIGIAVIRLHEIVTGNLRQYVSAKYGDDLKPYREDLAAFDKLAKTVGVDFHKIAEDNVVGVYHQMAHHLRLALDELKEVFRELSEGFTRSGFSWLHLFKVLGFEVGDYRKLQDEIMKAGQEELKAFKKS